MHSKDSNTDTRSVSDFGKIPGPLGKNNDDSDYSSESDEDIFSEYGDGDSEGDEDVIAEQVANLVYNKQEEEASINYDHY